MTGSAPSSTPSWITRTARPRTAACGFALGLAFSLWTGDWLADYLAERTGIRVSRETVYRLLRAGGIHLNRPQHTITSPDPEYAVKKRRWSAPVAR